MATTKGFQGEIAWVEESTYGDGVKTDSTLLLIANQVINVNVTHNKATLGETHNIDSPDIDDFIMGTKLYGLTTKYYADREYSSTNCLLYKAMTRVSADLPSIAFQVGVGVDQTTSSYFNLKGCKAKSISVDTSEDSPVTVSIDWSVKDVATSSAATTATADSITTSPWTYLGASFERNGLSSWGYAVGSVSMKVDNGLQDVKDIGNSTLIDAAPGIRNATGTVNVCLTDGGRTYWAECVNASAHDMELIFGAAGAPTMKITGCILNNMDVPLDSSSAIVMTNIPFTGKVPSLENTT